MNFFPIFLKTDRLKAVVIGGGKVAERKVLTLLNCGFSITVVSPDLTKELKKLGESGNINILQRKYKIGDLKSASLAFFTASDSKIYSDVRTEADKFKILLNCADDPDNCDFIMPSIIKRGSLKIAISTSGKSPILSAMLKKSFEKSIGKEYDLYLEILGVIRKYAACLEKNLKMKVLTSAASSKIPQWIKKKEIKKIEDFLVKISTEKLKFNQLDEMKILFKQLLRK